MHLDQLKYLIIISKYSSFSKASEALHLTPQALSMSMKKLEAELGITLFERNYNGVTLTPEGESVIDITRTFLNELNAIKQHERPSLIQEKEEIDIFWPHGATETYLPSLLSFIITNKSQYTIINHEKSYRDLIEDVRNQTIPFSLTYQLYLDEKPILQDIPDELTFQPFCTFKYGAVLNNRLTSSLPNTLSIQALAEHPFVNYSPSDYLNEAMFYYLGFFPSNFISAPNTVVLLHLLEKEPCWSLFLQSATTNQTLLNYPHCSYHTLEENIFVRFGCLHKQLSKDDQRKVTFLEKYFTLMYE